MIPLHFDFLTAEVFHTMWTGMLITLRVSLVAVFVVHEEHVAQRPVDDVEPDVRTELVRVGVVLQQRVQEHLRVEG